MQSFKPFCCTRLSSVTVGLPTQTLESVIGSHAVLYEPYDTGSLCIKTQSVPRSKHTVSVIQTSQLMLYREIIAVCSEIHTKHINTLCGQNVELVYVKPGCTRSNHWTFLYIHGSVHRESNLIIVQQAATYSVYYISVGSSTCFGC